MKAGQALKKDLNKRIPLTSTLRLRDPILEIDISDKQLTDDGFNEFIFDLRYVLEYKTADHPQGVYKLQELHLQGNLLSLDSLVELAKVIRLSAQDLKDLNISGNRINVITNSDVQKWQYFLHSFAQCCVLKKVDFSDNLLSSRGIEVLARVYIRSELDFVETGPDNDEELRASRPLTTKNEQFGANASPATASGHFSSQGGKPSHRRGSQITPASKVHTDAELRHFACTRGLRSVPYLILQNVGMTNGGIIHLAEMLKLHRTPEHLLTFLPCGKPPSLPDSENALRGIYWLPNETISKLSVKLMKLTNQLQQSSAESESEDEALAEEFQDLVLEEDSHGLERRQKRQKIKVELSRVVKLQRIDVLGSEGMLKCEIWHGALKMLTVARAILLDDDNRPLSAEEELEQTSSKRSTACQVQAPPSPLPQYAAAARSTNEWDTPPGVMISTFRFDPESSTFDLMFPAMHAPPEHPVLEARPPPVAVAMPGYPSSITQNPQVSASQPLPSQASSKEKASATEAQSSPIHSRGRGAPQNQYRFGLPLHLWSEIISQAVGVSRILHPDQQARILSYAASWSSLAAEVSINGAPEHQQLWKILDSIDCFTYKPLS